MLRLYGELLIYVYYININTYHYLCYIDSLTQLFCIIFQIIELSHIGGKNVKSVVKRLMSKLFTDCLLSNYSYTGKKGKNKFSNLFICSVIFGEYTNNY